MTFGDVATIATVDEIGDAGEQTVEGFRLEHAVAGVGQQGIEVLGRRVRLLPLIAGLDLTEEPFRSARDVVGADDGESSARAQSGGGFGHAYRRVEPVESG